MRRRRKEKVVSNSMSCTDDEWQRIRACAAAAGEGVGRHIVRRALTDDPSPHAKPRGAQALDPDEQREMHDAVVRLAGSASETGSGGESWLTVLPGCIRFLCAARITALLREGRANELDTQLRRAFGEEKALEVREALAGKRSPEGGM
ncbi:MAG: hypothetical protein OXF88_03715 [Rhodobacteraceae bacterium]|nr:hypothetical protein [Paracoccaceae bacterium]MCY4137025.1 hypothetical protein [Paracoccaceae bacterium]